MQTLPACWRDPFVHVFAAAQAGLLVRCARRSTRPRRTCCVSYTVPNGRHSEIGTPRHKHQEACQATFLQHKVSRKNARHLKQWSIDRFDNCHSHLEQTGGYVGCGRKLLACKMVHAALLVTALNSLAFHLNWVISVIQTRVQESQTHLRLRELQIERKETIG